MEIDGASARRGPGRPTAQQKEEWERAGFDAALAQALFARPLLAPAEMTAKRAGGAAPGERAQADEARRARAESASESPVGEEAWSPAASKDSAPPQPDSPTADEAGTVEVATKVVRDLPDSAMEESPASRMAIPSGFTPVTRAAAATSASASSEVGGAGAISGSSRPEERSSDRQEAGTNPQAEPAAPPETKREDAAQAAKIFRPVEVSFDAGDGQEGRLRVSVQGQAVRATIVAPDAPRARDLERSVPELHRALREKGFRKTEVSIRPARTRARNADPDAESRVTASPER